jgi:hypothetical protein
MQEAPDIRLKINTMNLMMRLPLRLSLDISQLGESADSLDAFNNKLERMKGPVQGFSNANETR